MAANETTETPTTAQIIAQTNDELTALAETIHADSTALYEAVQAIEEANELIETRRAEFMGEVFNERHEINLKLKYTNDDQRKVAVIELETANGQFQNLKNARRTAAEMSANAKANLEKNRNLHRAKLLVLQYYAAQS